MSIFPSQPNDINIWLARIPFPGPFKTRNGQTFYKLNEQIIFHASPVGTAWRLGGCAYVIPADVIDALYYQPLRRSWFKLWIRVLAVTLVMSAVLFACWQWQ